MKVIIAGSRDFNDYALLRGAVDYELQGLKPEDVEIVSGGARGADELGERYANERGYKVRHFYPNWPAYGKAAGPIRNREMSEYADFLIAFWDGKSRGTMSMIELATRKGLKVETVLYF